MTPPDAAAPSGWRARLPEGVRPYVEPAPLAAAFLGVSSGFAFAMIGATLTTRLAQYGIRKSAVTAFALTFLAYNFKFLWAPLVDNVRLPVLGRVRHEYNLARFTRTFGTLLANGVPILTALGIAGETVEDAQLRDAIKGVAPKVKSGGRLAEALQATGSFEPLAVNLIRVGEETGTLDRMALEMATVLDRKVETGIKRGLTLLEPILILGLGLVIAVVIVSILMGILTVNELAI